MARTDITLGIDTAAGIDVGLSTGRRRTITDTRRHAEALMTAVTALLEEAGLTLADVGRIGVGVGPGPFTGLRVGLATAQTLGFALDVPVTGVCSLDVIALDFATNGPDVPPEFVAALDARRRELFWARYDRAGRRLGEPRVGDPRDLPGLPVVGPGAAVYPDLVRPVGGPLGVDAAFLAAHLGGLPDAGLEPLYLRQPDADVPGTRKSVLTTGLRLPSPAGGPS